MMYEIVKMLAGANNQETPAKKAIVQYLKKTLYFFCPSVEFTSEMKIYLSNLHRVVVGLIQIKILNERAYRVFLHDCKAELGTSASNLKIFEILKVFPRIYHDSGGGIISDLAMKFPEIGTVELPTWTYAMTELSNSIADTAHQKAIVKKKFPSEFMVTINTIGDFSLFKNANIESSAELYDVAAVLLNATQILQAYTEERSHGSK